MKRVLAILTIAAVLFGAGPAMATGTAPERQLQRLTNRARIARDIPVVHTGWRLKRAARAQARRMAGAYRIYHSTGSYDFRGRRCFGQNVGVTLDIPKLHRAFMRSPAHRSNILNRCFRRVGIGIVHSRGFYWAVVNFSS